ncbi:hypothetical protein LL972_11370 [Xanthomonas campestris pv. asclepiadis]|nr:hypothetical protein [Xanthomonas campestris]MCC4616593.1 hypothetical protein [Xanthomonas campestris pv. asclepiadis]
MFRSYRVEIGQIGLHVVTGGKGPPVLLLGGRLASLPFGVLSTHNFIKI